MAKQHTLKLSPFPAFLILSLDQKPFKEKGGQFENAIGLTVKNGSFFQICINLENDKKTQTAAVIHETAHVTQFLEEFIDTDFDEETFAYMSQTIATFVLDKLDLLPS